MRSGGGGGRDGDGGVVGGGAANGTPEEVRKTIQNIRETTGKQHSDEDIYSLLQDCSMDADDTAQKLLYLDTFHEVKKKRDWKKEMSPKQGHRARGGQGKYSAHHVSSDAFVGRNAASRRGNGVNHVTQRNYSSSLPAVQRTNGNLTSPVTKVSSLSNGSSGLGSRSGPQLHVSGAGNGIKDHSVADMMNSGSTALLPTPPASSHNWTCSSVVQAEESRSTSSSSDQNSPSPAAVSGIYSSASDPILAPSKSRDSGAVGTMKWEVGSQQKAAELNHTQGQLSDEDVLQLPKNDGKSLGILSPENRKKVLGKSNSGEKNQLHKPLHPSSLTPNDGPLLTRSYGSHSPEESIVPAEVDSSEDAQFKANSQLLPDTSVPNGLVTFPNHFRVPEALRSGLTFGSFTAQNFGLGVKNGNGSDSGINSSHAIDPSLEADAIARDKCLTSNVQDDHFDQPQSPKKLLDEVPLSDGNDAPDSESKDDKVKQDVEGHQNASIESAPSYGFGRMQPMQGGHLAQFEGHEAQAQDISHVSGFVSENLTASPSPSPSPPVQNSVAASPQPFLFRPPYHPHLFLYGHYCNPYFLPSMQHFLSQSGLPQPSISNAYLTPAPTAPTAKVPLPQVKPGTGLGNPTPIGLSPLYGSCGSFPIGFALGPAASSTGKEDMSASQLKENRIFTTGPVSEVSAWFPSPGQDISSLQFNSLYHSPAQGQHLTYSHAQAGTGPFTGVYPPLQTMTTPSTINPLLQQSQVISTAVETTGLASGAYQQLPQFAQINWKPSY